MALQWRNAGLPGERIANDENVPVVLRSPFLVGNWSNSHYQCKVGGGHRIFPRLLETSMGQQSQHVLGTLMRGTG
jgi:hypothetical protein